MLKLWKDDVKEKYAKAFLNM